MINEDCDLERVLHVEDDGDIREIARLSLETIGGYDLLQCACGAEALKEAEAFAPDILLLDMMMPDLNGSEVLAKLRKIEKFAKTPAIFMTAKAEGTVAGAMAELGVIGLVEKPFDPVTLPERMRSMIAAAQV